MAQADDAKIDYDSREYDIIIYGATGFTGSIAAIEFIKRYATSNINFKWGISGRNNDKLTKLRVELQNEYKLQIENLNKIVPLSNTPSFLNDKNKKLKEEKQKLIDNLPIIIADVKNEESLSTMITSTKLVISCIGPYRLIGEKVIELCAKNGTHYVDICGEPDFMERCAFKYYKEAEKNKALIVSACGFDSIPSDMGVAFVDQFYTKNGGICSSINGYLTGTAPDGYQIHHTTLKAAVYGMNEADKLRALRKEIEEKGDYRTSKKKIKRNGPKQKIKKEVYFWSDQVKKYSMLFPFADSSVVANSQGITSSLLTAQNVKNKTFPQYACYISFNSYWNVVQAVSIGGLGKFLINYEFGRNLLCDYPSLMTFGVFSEEGPSKKQRSTQTFKFRFFAKGYSKALCTKYDYDTEKLNNLNPDFNINASVSGQDIAYRGTCKILIECGIVLLQEQGRINEGDLDQGFPAIQGGVFTPSTVFGNTSLIERLNEAGINFNIELNDDDDDDDDYEEKVDIAPSIQNNDNNKKEDVEIVSGDKGKNQNDPQPTDDEYDYDKYDNVDADDVPK